MTTQPGDPTFHTDRIRGALCYTPDLRELYLDSATFHQAIDQLTEWLPLWVDAMASSARASDDAQRVAVEVMKTRVPVELPDLMEALDRSMAEATEARDRMSFAGRVIERHDYEPSNAAGSPCCEWPEDDDIHVTMPLGDIHDHNVGAESCTCRHRRGVTFRDPVCPHHGDLF